MQPVAKTVIHGSDFGHDDVNASKEGCGVCLNLPRNIVVVLIVLILGKCFCHQSRSAFGRLVATLLVSLVSQRFVPRGGPALLVGLVRQRFLLRGRSTLFVGVISQCFLPCGSPALLVGLVCQRFLPRGPLMATLLRG